MHDDTGQQVTLGRDHFAVFVGVFVQQSRVGLLNQTTNFLVQTATLFTLYITVVAIFDVRTGELFVRTRHQLVFYRCLDLVDIDLAALIHLATNDFCDGGAVICVIDSRAAAGTMVLLIRRAQALMEAAGDDGDFDALCQQLHRYQATLRTCFTLENFDNLIKNGRMRPIVGTLLRSLGIHIIADATAEGTIHVADKARGVGKTYRAITALMKASKDCTDAEVVISHCENLEGAMALKRQILADLPVKQVDLLSCRGLTSFYAMEKGLIVGY